LSHTENNWCNICKDLIPLVKDGVASEQSQRFVLAHIDRCVECHNEYESYSAFPIDEISEAADRKIIKKAKLRIWIGVISILLFGLFLGIDISTTGSRLVFLVPIVAFAVLSIINYKANTSRMIWIFSFIVVYVGAYFIWSNVVLFEPDIGAWVAAHFTFLSAFISVVASYFNRHWLACSTAFGFNFGIIAGGLWGQTSFDPGGGMLHNGWLIWVFVFVGCIVVGGIIEIVKGFRKPL